jgi:glycosyltransferase involved in cell wall biosynthesis
MALVGSDRARVKATIIVPAYNAADLLPRCLEGLCAQQTPAPYEVVVVDSSDDGSERLVRERFPAVGLVHLLQRALPGKARNEGVREARGEILCFTDADCLCPPGWLDRHLVLQEDWDVVGGSVENGNPESWVGWASYLLEFSGFTPSARQATADCLVTANISYKHSLFAEGGFPEDVWPGEDRIFHRRLAQRRPLFFDGQNHVSHVNRSGLRSLFAHQRRLGAAASTAWGRIGAHGLLLAVPELAAFTPMARMGLIAARLLRDTPAQLLRAALVAPVILAGAGVWAWAFWREAGRGIENVGRS